MIRITDTFTLRRVAGQLAVSVGPVVETLTASQARDAVEAFNVMAVMMGDEAEDIEVEEAA